MEPVSLALAGGFLTTAPPGKSLAVFLMEPNSFVVSVSFSRGYSENAACRTMSSHPQAPSSD